MPESLAICARLKELREKLFAGRGGLSRLAEKAGISTGALSECERFRVPSTERVIAIVKATGCSFSWLLTGEGSMFGPEPVAQVAPSTRERSSAPLLLRAGETPENYLTTDIIRVTLPAGVEAGDVIEIHFRKRGKP